MENYLKKKLIIIIIAFILFVTGVTFLVLTFVKPDNNKFLWLALGFTFAANFLIVFANVFIRPKELKTKKK